MSASGWIGFDLDGTLATYGGWKGDGSVGEPITPMINRVKEFLAQGVEVRIVTARVSEAGGSGFAEAQRKVIEDWCEKHIGQRLKVTASKDFTMVCLYDDRAVQVEMNTGKILGREL